MHSALDIAPFLRRAGQADFRSETAFARSPPRRCLLACLLLATAVITACQQTPLESQEYLDDTMPPTLAPLFAFLATATAGETEAVGDSRTGATVTVTTGRAYHAASGRFCRLFRVTPPQTYENLTEGLACRDERSHWTVSALLINPEDLESPIRTQRHRVARLGGLPCIRMPMRKTLAANQTAA